jgi:DNA (cytosine-5)-methyltransferase 1
MGRRNAAQKHLRCIDLFCGIGGFRYAAESFGLDCVFSSDIDAHCRQAYGENFGDLPHGDITQIDPGSIPDHDILLGGFPCQPFSIIGERKGFNDARGTLFFNVARIIKAKRPRGFVLENVKQLAGHNGGRTIRRIQSILRGLGYSVDWRILNALHFGLPQKRERIFIVGVRDGATPFRWLFPVTPMRPLVDLLEKNVPQKYLASPAIIKKRQTCHQSQYRPAIWHENKAGNISSYPYSCALRAGASYNYLLVDGRRRLTPREMLRLQGFPDSFKIATTDSQNRKQAGNAVPVPMATAVLGRLLAHIGREHESMDAAPFTLQRRVLLAA